MTDKDRLPAMSFRPSRRQVVAGMGALGAFASAPHAFAQAPKRVPIQEGEFTPQPIAIPNFVAGTPQDAEVGAGVAQVITNNLKRSGLFAPIDPAAFIERITNPDNPPTFQSWKQIGAQALVIGRMTRQPDGRVKAEFRLWDVNTQQQLAGQQYDTRRSTGGGSPTSSPTRSMSGRPAKRAISTAASCSSTRPGPRSAASSGWR